MRTMMQVVVPVERGNATVNDGTLPTVIQETLERVKAEAAYFTTDGLGRRCAYVFFDLEDPSQIPAIAEPLFQNVHASVEFRPAMNAEDLEKGLRAWAGGGS